MIGHPVVAFLSPIDYGVISARLALGWMTIGERGHFSRAPGHHFIKEVP
jgi:hypothetical protein